MNRYPAPELKDLPEDIRERYSRCRKKPASCPTCSSRWPAVRPSGARSSPTTTRCMLKEEGSLTKGEREMIVTATSAAQQLPVLRGGAWRAPAHLREETAGRRPGGGELPQGRHHTAPAGHARFRDEGLPGSDEIGEEDFAPLHAHGFSDEDIWDIAAITAFFGLSNRMASFSNMMPNPEFYLMGRVPKQK